MNKAILAVAGLALFGLLLLASSLLGICVGAAVGAIVGYFFPGTVGLVGSIITGGLTIPTWQVGAILGFVGAFIKTSVTTSGS